MIAESPKAPPPMWAMNPLLARATVPVFGAPKAHRGRPGPARPPFGCGHQRRRPAAPPARDIELCVLRRRHRQLVLPGPPAARTPARPSPVLPRDLPPQRVARPFPAAPWPRGVNRT
ncbi:hypothetical protein TNIN_500391 [Trichonephila inaurata madagascariensis]|uniref:Uncharacterized protein n=1 Tax=Trichonephila inaurata madagascariensis TaxID=2747483 RepID=A0A8X7C176_9ARAC|nr:hypothetical protein TNIN_500391 [Trichonephila inaurata madagascariensis]